MLTSSPHPSTRIPVHTVADSYAPNTMIAKQKRYILDGGHSMNNLNQRHKPFILHVENPWAKTIMTSIMIFFVCTSCVLQIVWGFAAMYTSCFVFPFHLTAMALAPTLLHIPSFSLSITLPQACGRVWPVGKVWGWVGYGGGAGLTAGARVAPSTFCKCFWYFTLAIFPEATQNGVSLLYERLPKVYWVILLQTKPKWIEITTGTQ